MTTTASKSGISQRTLLRIFGIGVVALLGFALIRGPVAEPAKQQPGSPAVYQRIAATSDCTALQAEFDQAYSDHEAAPNGSNGRKWTLGYMEAAQDRMSSLSC